jgi:2-oxoglutarate ferredoxin oxidoreductase subunit alpha
LRPLTLVPFPSKRINELSENLKGILTVEMSAGQMVEDVRLAVCGKTCVVHFGRMGGVVPTPEEVVESMKSNLKGK